ncbi:hypothetical protein D3C77_381690 [compost metagenome]
MGLHRKSWLAGLVEAGERLHFHRRRKHDKSGVWFVWHVVHSGSSLSGGELERRQQHSQLGAMSVEEPKTKKPRRLAEA